MAEAIVEPSAARPAEGSKIAPRSAAASAQAQTTDPAEPTSGPQHFEFTGTGPEYFRIWIVNLLLTLSTLGIYTAWAKVRRVQYFYRNTRVADSVFD